VKNVTAKTGIVEELGAAELLLPALVNEALAANDRIKYYFSLLQTAGQRASNPEGRYPPLRTEREAAGIRDPRLDHVVGGSKTVSQGVFFIPMCNEIVLWIGDSLEAMIRPVSIADPESAAGFEHRKESLYVRMPRAEDCVMSGSAIRAMTSGDSRAGDSLHLLVMDLHKALNTVQAGLCTEVIDGARAYMLSDEDRVLVMAFMAGVNRTAPLRFDHPGLTTTATRSGDHLVLQNDIGMTDAHVIVINIREREVTITYSDVHLNRLVFFQGLFESQGVTWQETRSRQGGSKLNTDLFHLSVGRHNAAGPAELSSFLTYLGSRLVFLIDWNRARKRLRNFLPNRDAIAALKWAADKEVGHMAFLELGGERLVYDALELTAHMPLKYGEPLHSILGREKTFSFICRVLSLSSEGLRKNLSRLLISDEIKAELLGSFRSAHEDLIGRCQVHATLTVEVATAVRDTLLWIERGASGENRPDVSARVKGWESDADIIVSQVRALSHRVETAEFYAVLITMMDDAIDALEEAAFFTRMVGGHVRSVKIQKSLTLLAEDSLSASRELLKALYAAEEVQARGSREDLQEFLEAIDRVASLEHSADEGLRKMSDLIFMESTDYKELRAAFECGRMIEESTNALMKAGFILRDSLLEQLNR
jgi:uncharacterized protein Yka (UPF0111/DUF47 family)